MVVNNKQYDFHADSHSSPLVFIFVISAYLFWVLPPCMRSTLLPIWSSKFGHTCYSHLFCFRALSCTKLYHCGSVQNCWPSPLVFAYVFKYLHIQLRDNSSMGSHLSSVHANSYDLILNLPTSYSFEWSGIPSVKYCSSGWSFSFCIGSPISSALGLIFIFFHPGAIPFLSAPQQKMPPLFCPATIFLAFRPSLLLRSCPSSTPLRTYL